MPALLLLPEYYTEPSSIPSPLPCQQHYKQLRDTNYWQHLCHLQNKAKVSAKDDTSEIFQLRIIPSSNYYMEIHDGTFLLIAASQKILPKPKGDPISYLGSHIIKNLTF